MPPLSKIIKYGLESRARELYDSDISLSEIALALSNESGQNITKAMTFNYLGSEARCNAAVIEKKAQLQVAIVEAEISTIEDRLFFITEMKDLVRDTEDERIKVMATEAGTKALDSLDKRIGRLSNVGINIDNSKTENTLNVVVRSPQEIEQEIFTKLTAVRSRYSSE